MAEKRAITFEEWEAAGKDWEEWALREWGPRRGKELTVGLPLAGPRHPWMAIATFVLRRGRPVIAELEIVLEPNLVYDMPPEGLTAADLRKISLRVPNLRGAAAVIFAKAGLDVDIKATLAPRYSRKTDDFYAEKANEYLLALSHAPTRPRVWLVEEYGKRGYQVKVETMRDWIHGARKRGFLTGYPGRAGAEPTDKLKEWNRAKAAATTTKRRRK